MPSHPLPKGYQFGDGHRSVIARDFSKWAKHIVGTVHLDYIRAEKTADTEARIEALLHAVFPEAIYGCRTPALGVRIENA